MGLIKGSLSLTRYRVTGAPPENLSDDYLSEKFLKNSFVDIEHAPLETSLGWVEFFNHLGTDFSPATYRFGGLIAATVRLDTRKVPAKTIARYYAISEAEYIGKVGRKPNSLAKKELKETVKSNLLRRALINTELMEVAWLHQENELWLAATGEMRRNTFEELWGRTIALPLQMLVPSTLGLEIVGAELRKALIDSTALPIWLG
ncbi:MAG: recombination-associated protein RdgC [Candidatus Adiutrix sp.]